MKKLLKNKSEEIIAELENNKEKSFNKEESLKIIENISKGLKNDKRIIEHNQKKSKIEASKIILIF